MASWAPGWGVFPAGLREFWTERHLATLTTQRPDGRLHVVPVGAVLDHDQRCAWIISGGASRKVRNLLAAGPSGGPLAVCSVDGGRWSTLEGTGVVHDDPDRVARACEQYAARYRQPRPNPERVAIRIEVDRFLASAALLD